MMTFRLQILIIICMIIALGYITLLTRKKRIDFKYSLLWILIGIVILVLAIWPVLLEKISHLLGVASPVNMLFFLGFIFSLYIIFSLSRTVSDLSDKVKKLSQEIAILRKDALDKDRPNSKGSNDA